ncbi:MAG TPA: carboxypeptidase-like regulatory domain-containing protein [Pyrinomonadaceae bacterium]|nr:carboxypeptidase-like regulatory domain-containing protein [Pyrinomonadaceae bacterium]
MIRKIIFSTLAVVFSVTLLSASAVAQGAPVRGEVKIKKADGSVVPAVDAVVEAFRTDTTRGSLPPSKTNRRGEFSFVQIPYGQTFALAVSGPGMKPWIEPGVRAGRDNIVITVDEGDGQKLTEDDVRKTLSAAVSPTGESVEEQKRLYEEEQKKIKEISEKNRKIQESDAIASKANSDGAAALKAKDYNTAIAKFTEGVEAVPDFVGSTPIMLNGKMVAHRARGYEFYREGASTTDGALRRSKFAEANKDYDDGLAAFDQAMAIIKAAPAPADANEQKTRANVKLELLTNAVEIHRLKAIGQVDNSKGQEASMVISEYLLAETDPVKKATAEMTLADILRENGDCDGSIPVYKRILGSSPDNVDALAGAGLCLFSAGYGNDDKTQMQEGLNLMQRFIDTAPDTHRLKTSVRDAVDLLKNEQKLTPQRAPARRRP